MAAQSSLERVFDDTEEPHKTKYLNPVATKPI